MTRVSYKLPIKVSNKWKRFFKDSWEFYNWTCRSRIFSFMYCCGTLKLIELNVHFLLLTISNFLIQMEYFYIEATTFHGNFCKKLIGIFVFGDTIFEIIVWNICPRPVVWLGSFLPLPQLWPLKKNKKTKIN